MFSRLEIKMGITESFTTLDRNKLPVKIGRYYYKLAIFTVKSDILKVINMIYFYRQRVLQ
jgi:hypothetical protein